MTDITSATSDALQGDPEVWRNATMCVRVGRRCSVHGKAMSKGDRLCRFVRDAREGKLRWSDD